MHAHALLAALFEIQVDDLSAVVETDREAHPLGALAAARGPQAVHVEVAWVAHPHRVEQRALLVAGIGDRGDPTGGAESGHRPSEPLRCGDRQLVGLGVERVVELVGGRMLHTAKRCEVLGGQSLAQRTTHEAVRGLRGKPDPTLRPERIMRRGRRHRRCKAHKAGAGIPGAASQAGPVLGGSAVVVDDHPERQNAVPRAVQPTGRGCPLATRKLRLVEKLLQLRWGGKQQPALTAAVALAVMLHMRQPLRPVPHRRGVADHQNLQVGGAVECRQLTHHRPQ